MIKLTWYNECDLNNILYHTSLQQWCWFEREDIGNPDYSFNKEVSIRDGIQVYNFKQWEKSFRFDFVTHEIFADVFTQIPLHDTVQFTKDGETVTCSDIDVQVEWPDNGLYAKITIEFKVDTVIKGACCNNLTLDRWTSGTWDFEATGIGTSTPASPSDGDNFIQVDSLVVGIMTGNLLTYSVADGAWSNKEVSEGQTIEDTSTNIVYYVNSVDSKTGVLSLHRFSEIPIS